MHMTDHMGRVTCDLTVSVDGYSAGLNQTEERPFGDDGGDGWGDKLHAWYADSPEENRAEWNGWWGDDPPYHAPVFVLTPPPARAAADVRRHHVPLRRVRTGTGAGDGR